MRETEKRDRGKYIVETKGKTRRNTEGETEREGWQLDEILRME
jgi:hypothetical protein